MRILILQTCCVRAVCGFCCHTHIARCGEFDICGLHRVRTHGHGGQGNPLFHTGPETGWPGMQPWFVATTLEHVRNHTHCSETPRCVSRAWLLLLTSNANADGARGPGANAAEPQSNARAILELTFASGSKYASLTTNLRALLRLTQPFDIVWSKYVSLPTACQIAACQMYPLASDHL